MSLSSHTSVKKEGSMSTLTKNAKNSHTGIITLRNYPQSPRNIYIHCQEIESMTPVNIKVFGFEELPSQMVH
jgi:hypothetical protein